jgi:hypothetical protein
MILKKLTSTALGKTALTLTAIAAIGSVGAYSTFAGLADAAATPKVKFKGGTLDINTDNSGKVVSSTDVDIANMKPSESLTGTVVLSNDGSVRADMKVAPSWTNTSGCFTYTLKDGSTVVLADATAAVSLGLFGAHESKTYTITVTENECASADRDDALAPTAELGLDVTATQATGKG